MKSIASDWNNESISLKTTCSFSHFFFADWITKIDLKYNWFLIVLFQIFIEFCDGGALDTIIVDLEKGLTEKQIAYVCRGMCQGLVHLHKQGIIHRDLKAGNVLLTCQVFMNFKCVKNRIWIDLRMYNELEYAESLLPSYLGWH